MPLSEDAERIVRDLADPVIEHLAPLSDGSPFMIVGAVCRDALHAEHGHEASLRSTSDLDLALALPAWNVFERIDSAMPRIESTSGIRYRIAGRAVDLLPFGDVEDPDGIVTPRRRVEPMNVFGFQDVLARATPVRLGRDADVRLPTAAGYTALKLMAWADRSSYGEYKDAEDLATALFWYRRSPEVSDRLFGSANGLAHLERCSWDLDSAAALLLIDDVLDLLSPSRTEVLRQTWQDIDDVLLGRWLVNSRLPNGPDPVGRRLALAALWGEALRRSPHGSGT